MTTAYDAPHDEIEGRYWSPTRIALIVVVSLMVAMWVWIYIWAPRTNPDRLDTRSFATQAEEFCEPIAVDLADLPRTSTDTTISQRADLVSAGTELTATMVEGLRAEAETVSHENDRQLLDLWFEDWDAYLSDREAYSTRLRAAPADADRSDLAFTLTERSSGGLYTRTIDGFANVNEMPSCRVPSDI